MFFAILLTVFLTLWTIIGGFFAFCLILGGESGFTSPLIKLLLCGPLGWIAIVWLIFF